MQTAAAKQPEALPVFTRMIGGVEWAISARTAADADAYAMAETARRTHGAEMFKAMVAFEMNPGHSDLDNEQPITLAVWGDYYGVTLGEIRQAKRLARSQKAGA